MEIFDFVLSIPYLPEAVTVLAAGHALALAVVNLTPTPKDNELVAKVYKYVELAAGIVNARKVKS
jgi:hypothetical protein